MRRLLTKILSLLCVVVIASCSDDDDNSVPSLRADILNALTNSDSIVTDLQLDNGRTFRISGQTIKGTLPNAQLRCLASYTLSADSVNATIYGIKSVTCAVPLVVDSVKTFPHDPVKVQSVWKSGDYINICLAALTNEGAKHKYNCVIDSTISRTLYVSFIFQRDSTALEAYSQYFYHSIPLKSQEYPSDFDSLILSINTYEGIKTYPFKR